METRGLPILVVEDEALIAMLVESTLAEAGYRVLGPVADTGSALALLEAGPRPAAAVLDVNLGGREDIGPVCEALDRLGVAYLLATGYPGAMPGLPCRPKAWLQKPYDPGELVRILGRLLGEHAPRA